MLVGLFRLKVEEKGLLLRCPSRGERKRRKKTIGIIASLGKESEANAVVGEVHRQGFLAGLNPALDLLVREGTLRSGDAWLAHRRRVCDRIGGCLRVATAHCLSARFGG